jgi:hypothetical protein
MLEEQRIEIRKSLVETASYLSFESLRSLENFLEKRWSKLDKSSEACQYSWWEYFDEIGNVICLF